MKEQKMERKLQKWSPNYAETALDSSWPHCSSAHSSSFQACHFTEIVPINTLICPLFLFPLFQKSPIQAQFGRPHLDTGESLAVNLSSTHSHSLPPLSSPSFSPHLSLSFLTFISQSLSLSLPPAHLLSLLSSLVCLNHTVCCK